LILKNSSGNLLSGIEIVLEWNTSNIFEIAFCTVYYFVSIPYLIFQSYKPFSYFSILPLLSLISFPMWSNSGIPP
jgi:hypothetical protein